MRLGKSHVYRERAFWGVLHGSHRLHERPLLLGARWDDGYRDAPASYAGQPTAWLLFTTREDARRWCRAERAKYLSRPAGDPVRAGWEIGASAMTDSTAERQIRELWDEIVTLRESNRRLVAELGDAKQSVIDLQGANAAYVRANGRLRAEADAEKLLRKGFSTLANAAADYFEALEIAHRHLDMAALQVSHPKDAETIRTALAERPSDQPTAPQETKP